MRAVGALLLMYLLAAPEARADEPSPAVKAKVRAKIKRARTFFENGSYDEAVGEYEAAYKLIPIPDILYNIGQIRRTQPDYPKAIKAYKRYLEAAPDGQRAEDAKGFIAELTRELVPEGMRDRFDTTRRELAAFQAKHGDALDERWEGILNQLYGGDTEIDGALTALRQEIKERMHPKPAEPERPAVAVRKAPARKGPAQTPPLLKKWWFWTAVGGGAALVLAIGLGAGLGGEKDPTPSIGVLK